MGRLLFETWLNTNKTRKFPKATIFTNKSALERKDKYSRQSAKKPET